MRIVKQLLVYLTAFGLAYFGAFNHGYPLIMAADLAVFGILVFLWIFLPMLKANDIPQGIRTAELFRKYRIPKLLLFSWLVWIGFIQLKLDTPDHALVVMFWILKIAIAIILESILVMLILIDDIVPPLR